jgi:hypothetical protein
MELWPAFEQLPSSFELDAKLSPLRNAVVWDRVDESRDVAKAK